MWRHTLVLLSLGFVACAGRKYIYRPVTNTGAEVAGWPAASYAIPPETPRGDIRLATLGIVDITPAGASEDVTVRALHLREVIANNSDKPWIVDTREQRVALANDGESRAAYATADPGTPPPVIEVPPGGKRTLDLFFPLPPRFEDAGELPAFDVIWTVRTEARPVTARTPFERLEVRPVHSPYDYPWGPPYWYDPLYPGAAFIGVSLPPLVVQQPVIVRPPPARRVR